MHNNFESPIIHRDIKTINVLLSKKYQVKICDLGLSKYDNIFTMNLKTLGDNNFKRTLPYMAPEIIEEKEATVSSALACTIVEIYKENVLWNISSVMKLIMKFTKKEKPDLRKTSIPRSLINDLDALITIQSKDQAHMIF